MTALVLRGDARRLPLPDASVDAIVCDPPYELGFMGRGWDASGVAFQPATWAEVLRVLKPGGFALCFGGTRTYHRLACALEDAGFEIRDSVGCLTWTYAQGFPKSRDVTGDLRAMPACECGVGAEIADDGGPVVGAGGPAGAVGTSIGAEPGPVGLAPLAAQLAGGPVAKSGTGALGRLGGVQTLDVELGREGNPVVLGPSGMARGAEGGQVSGFIGGVEVQPEPLRNQVVGDQVVGASAIKAGAITADDGRADLGPAATLVLPLATSPSGVSASGVASAVVDGHASAGAIDRLVGPSVERSTADPAGVHPVAGGLPHAPHPTAEHWGIRRCERCGGRVGEPQAGLGTALKPAWEPIVVARKPLAGTVAQTVMAYGTGALNVDGCRTEGVVPQVTQGAQDRIYGGGKGLRSEMTVSNPHPAGRWPTNLVLVHHPHCQQVGEQAVSSTGAFPARRAPSGFGRVGTDDGERTEIPDRVVPVMECVPGCPVAEMDAQGGIRTSGANPTRRGQRDIVPARGQDTGATSRYFPTFRFNPKADGWERPELILPDGTVLRHPTVKPVDLMRWLVRLVCPPGGTVLDPFAGSGATLQAAQVEGFRAVGVELDAGHCRLVRERLSWRWEVTPDDQFRRVRPKAPANPDQGDLWAGILDGTGVAS